MDIKTFDTSAFLLIWKSNKEGKEKKSFHRHDMSRARPPSPMKRNETRTESFVVSSGIQCAAAAIPGSRPRLLPLPRSHAPALVTYPRAVVPPNRPLLPDPSSPAKGDCDLEHISVRETSHRG